MVRFTSLYVIMCLKACDVIPELNKAPNVGDYYFIEHKKSIYICVGKEEEFYKFCKCVLSGEYLVFTTQESIHENVKMSWVPTIDNLVNIAVQKNDYSTLENLLSMYDKSYKVGLGEQLLSMIVSFQTGLIWSMLDLDFVEQKRVDKQIEEYNKKLNN